MALEDPQITPPAQPVQTPANPLIEALKAKNYDMTGFASDADLIPYLEQAAANAQNMEKMSRLAEYGQLYLENAGDFQKYMTDKQGVDPLKSAPAPDTPSGPQIPEYDPAWEQACDFDAATRRYVVKPAYQGMVNLSVADKLTAAKNWEAEQVRKMAREFPEMVKQYLPEKDIEAEQKAINEAVDARVNAILRERDEAEQSYQYLSQNMGKLYELKDGQPIRDPVTGDWKMTEVGKLTVDYANQAALPPEQGGLGLTGSALREYASRMAEADIAIKSPVDQQQKQQEADAIARAHQAAQSAAQPPASPPASTFAPDGGQQFTAPLTGPETMAPPQNTHSLGEQLKENFIAQAAREAERHGSAIENSDANRADSSGNGEGAVNVDDFRSMLESDFAEAGLIQRTG